MSQVSTGVRRVLEVPAVYDMFLQAVGVTDARKLWIREYLKPFTGARIFDIGCGTAELLHHLPDDIEYTGFDMSAAYIAAARKRHGARGKFVCSKVSAFETAGRSGAEDNAGGSAGAGNADAGYDIAMAFGVLHHLDDEEARQLFQSARRMLKPGGRLVTLDPAFVPGQSFLSRFVVSHDRGQNVRTPEAYMELGRGSFPDIVSAVLPKVLRIPADSAVLVCRF
jgi:SAM-dependent methyltransferase